MTAGAEHTLEGVAPYRQGQSEIPGAARIIKLSSNELPYPPSPAALAAFRGAAAQIGRYPDGTQRALRRALASVHNVPEANIFASNGSEEAIGLVIRSVIAPGEEMVTSQNSFVMTDIHARSAGASIVRSAESDHRVDVKAMLASVTGRTRIVYLCSPNNPTGTYTTGDELRRLEAELPTGVLLVIDAAYAEFADADDYETGQSLFSPSGRVVVTRSFSKAYGLAGLRVGWALAPDSVINCVERLRTPFNVNQAALAAAAAAALDRTHLAQTVARIRATRERFAAALRALGLQVLPSQANFVMLTFQPGSDCAEGLDAALRAKGILGRPAEKAADAYRITIGTEEEMSSALRAIRDWIDCGGGPQ